MITLNNKIPVSITMGGKNVETIKMGNEIVWSRVQTLPDYFYIENTYAGNNTLTVNTTQNGTVSGNHATSLQYSKDKSTWTTITLSGTNTISLSSGEKVYFRNDNGYFNLVENGTNAFYTTFSCSNNFDVGGNANTLLDYTDSNVSLKPYCFFNLFKSASNLYNSNYLSLPSTTLAENCYSNMFYGCHSLTTAPSLPATTLAHSCYYNMFANCSSLITAPSLPATTLAYMCYNSMFLGCTALTTAPSLPATTLVGSDPTVPGGCYAGMFYGCTALTTAPSLHATTLTEYCYQSMFKGCTSLNSVEIYANDISATSCLYKWLQNVAATGTFHNLGSATYSSGASGIPSGWTEVTE